jgi:molybdopterin-containing oxidoreductase family iron-sulfur binding subunit
MSKNKCSRNTCKPLTRRNFLKASAAGAATLAIPVGTSDASVWQSFFQKHFREMSKAEMSEVIKRMEKEYGDKYKTSFSIKTTGALPDTLFGYGLDLSRCIGCRRCVYACVRENNQSRDPQIHYISVLPEDGHFYMPVQCQQCENPPCVKVCPTKATWQEPDGIVVVDYNWCIGCRYCMAACPYGARRFNWGEPQIAREEINPETHYLGNRPRYKGVVEKCTFCIQRVRGNPGKYPACVEVCPVGARKFGNLLDPKSEIRYLIENKRVFRLKEELNTSPKFYYFFAT